MRGVSKTEQRIRETKPVPKLLDNALLKKIAHERDEAAFTQFFERNKILAVNLALHVTGDPASAEDAVQEAMLQVWHSAESFQGKDVRRWFTCIVVREAIQVWRSRNRMENKMKRAGQAVDFQKLLALTDQPDKKLERKEALGYLKKALLALPERQRVMLTLHYGAGFTQREVGRELGVSQKAISKSLEKALSDLRGLLQSSGLGAIVTLSAIDANLGEAICTLHAPSKNILNRILDAVFNSENLDSTSSAWHSVKALPPISVQWLLGGVTFCALAFSGVLVVNGIHADRSVSTELKKTLTQRTETPVEWMHHVWSFEEGPMKSFPHYHGEWKTWRPASKGKPAAMVTGKNVVARGLPVSVPRHPFKITLEIESSSRRETHYTGVGWAILMKVRADPEKNPGR